VCARLEVTCSSAEGMSMTSRSAGNGSPV
jgi:hypothetical protein